MCLARAEYLIRRCGDRKRTQERLQKSPASHQTELSAQTLFCASA